MRCLVTENVNNSHLFTEKELSIMLCKNDKNSVGGSVDAKHSHTTDKEKGDVDVT